MNHEKNSRLVTFQTWVYKRDWYEYSKLNSKYIPFVLVDRSPCQDPFFDQFQKPSKRNPVISGICRCWKNFKKGQVFVYLAPLDRRVAKDLKREIPNPGRVYLGVAAMRVVDVKESHDDAISSFKQNQYVAFPKETSHPPNIIGTNEDGYETAACRESSILWRKSLTRTGNKKDVSYTPCQSRSNRALWESNIKDYKRKAKEKKLKVAICEFLTFKGRQSLCLNPRKAPIIQREDWGKDVQMSRICLLVDDEIAIKLAKRIAEAGEKV
jgi:hypothetical protein